MLPAEGGVVGGAEGEGGGARVCSCGLLPCGEWFGWSTEQRSLR